MTAGKRCWLAGAVGFNVWGFEVGLDDGYTLSAILKRKEIEEEEEVEKEEEEEERRGSVDVRGKSSEKYKSRGQKKVGERGTVYPTEMLHFN